MNAKNKQPRRHLTTGEVQAIRDAYRAGEPLKDIAARMGRDPTYMQKVATGRAWAALPGAVSRRNKPKPPLPRCRRCSQPRRFLNDGQCLRCYRTPPNELRAAINAITKGHRA